jgi:hypothetical protein
MERLVDRYLRDGALALPPLHPNQRAYQAGKSVETALHRLVERAEKELDLQDIALVVFLDIEGASNSFDSMCAALVRREVSSNIVRGLGLLWRAACTRLLSMIRL